MEHVFKNVTSTSRGWVDLSNLVYLENSVNWNLSIGKTVDFRYDDVIGTLIIKGRKDAQYVYIDIPGYVENHPIYVGQIKNGQFGRVLKKITPEFKHNVGDVVNGLLIVDRYRSSKYKYYNYRCVHDGYCGYIREDHLENNHKCPVCTGNVVLKGYNDIATTRPDVAKLFCDKNETFMYMENSTHTTNFKCPRCGNIIYTNIVSVSRRGLSCKKCGDGISYPNKFIYNFIEQVCLLHENKGKQMTFAPEKKFEWSMNYQHNNKNLSGKKIYDIYIYEYNIIIENHGSQHYTNSFQHVGDALSVEDIQENDKIKKHLAVLHGIQEDHYVILDCRQSTLSYIKNSIMSSNLPMLLNFTEHDIDWQQCDKFATSSRVYEACCYWNSGIRTYDKIASIMKMHKKTIGRYIKKGKELNIITD